MLPSCCSWIDSDDGAFLHWNAITVAIVRRDGMVTIQWRGKRFGGKAGSLAQGKRFAERWVAAQRGFPGLSKRSQRETLARSRGQIRPCGAVFACVAPYDGAPE